ncbi:hypothetical protein HMI54_011364, partial [Coelomomyces lativittatus]
QVEDRIEVEDYKELTEKWKFNPENVQPKTLAVFEKYLETNQIKSVNVLHQPRISCHPSPKLQKIVDDSNAKLFYRKNEVIDKIKEVTQGNINELKLGADQELFLNILYLNLGWYTGFDLEWRLSKFHINDHDYQYVSYMKVTENFSFIDDPE